jgi:hypothetical protein
MGGFHNYSRYRTDTKQAPYLHWARKQTSIEVSHGRAHNYVPEHGATNFGSGISLGDWETNRAPA